MDTNQQILVALGQLVDKLDEVNSKLGDMKELTRNLNSEQTFMEQELQQLRSAVSNDNFIG